MVDTTKMHEGDSHCEGNNNYHIPHTGKQSLERRGKLPTTITLSPQIYEESKQWAEEGHLHELEHELANQATSGESDSDDGIGMVWSTTNQLIFLGI